MRHVNSCRGDERALTCALCNQSVLFPCMSHPEPIKKHIEKWSTRKQKRPVSSRRYVTLDFNARAALDIDVRDLALALTIEGLAKKTGSCFASQRYLAETIGVSTRTMQRQIVRLRKAGLIEGSAKKLAPTSEFSKVVNTFREQDKMPDRNRQSVA